MLGASFQQFLIEALLASSSLRGGLTALNKSKYYDKGSFYNSFFQLSIGLERFFKIIYVVQYMIENDFNRPTVRQLKEIGHDINSLHQNAVSIALKYTEYDESTWVLNEEQSEILTMLSEFGEKTRYYNLNTIVKDKNKMNDPLVAWNDIIESCYWKYVPSKKRARIQYQAIQWADSNRLLGFSNDFGLDGHIMTYVDIHMLNWKVINISPYIVWEVISLLQPYYSLLISLRDAVQEREEAQNIRDPLVPYFHEVFPYFLLDRSATKRRRNWML
ncbi:hypothetical protein FORC065_2485 [Yersinia enterocolitica]|nr:hypothetical protein FORC065_2485 [Yersinia enterocolitica]